MKTHLFTAIALTLFACEGEPPKTPAGQLPARANETAQTEETATSDTTPSPAATASTPSMRGNCMGGMMGNTRMGSMMGAGDAGSAASDAEAAPVATPPPAPAENGNVVGHVTTTPSGAAANAVVFFEDGPVDPPPKHAAIIDNHMMNFIPFVQVVQAGGRVVFQNSDPFPHNVFSPDNGGFNIGVIPQHASSSRVFKTPGEFSLLCNLHPGMLGYIVATPNGHFARTNATGNYTIKDVPPGSYHVTAWAPRQKPISQSVTVTGGDVTLDFELHR